MHHTSHEVMDCLQIIPFKNCSRVWTMQWTNHTINPFAYCYYYCITVILIVSESGDAQWYALHYVTVVHLLKHYKGQLEERTTKEELE